MEEEGESEMGRKRSRKWSQGELEESAGEMHERLWSRRRERPEASFDEIMERVRREREAMMRVTMSASTMKRLVRTYGS